MSGSRHFISLAMVVLFPLSLFAADTGSAILHTRGGVWVNGEEVADSTAIFPGDSLETKSGFVANLDTEGSSILIQGESVVKFQGNYLVLEHGSVAVGTSTSMSVHVNCLNVEPLSNDRTQYDVTDLTGKVEVAAHKNDVNIKQGGALAKPSAASSASQSATVQEGHQAARDETIACGAPPPPQGAGSGGGMNTKWIEIGAGVGGGALVLCLLLCKGTPSPPASPWQP
ncbi:MAG: hypothetical protein WB919_13385 [Candidatus Sulfotelmatobacter sp.]